MSYFTEDLEALVLHLCCRKVDLTSHLKKNYRENIHYIVERDNFKNTSKYGGQNKITYKLTEDAYEILKNSYNLRNRYIVDVSDKVKCINIGMCIENQTIGFIENTYSSLFTVKRQFTLGKYRADLYFVDYKLVVECDENNHAGRDPVKEKEREDFIISLGNRILRYNPNTASFDLSNVLREINEVLFASVKPLL